MSDEKSVPQAQDAQSTPVVETPVEEPAQNEQEEEIVEQTSQETQPDEAQDAKLVELPHRDVVPGMIIRVHERIKDVSPKGEERERVQIFEGIVIGIKGKSISRTMTVRKDSKGFMVEKIYPLSSPNIVKIEVKRQFKVRRAKLHHLRGAEFKRKLKEIKN